MAGESLGPYCPVPQCGWGIFSQLRYARSRHSSIHAGSPFFWEISRMTSSLRPGATVSDSISVTKPYLYGWSTWASIPLLIGAPEVLVHRKLQRCDRRESE